ncbi:unnamed protein product [Rhizophagus irregularis]|nr:unnamed protein product [Rhizophagus irregularis]
MSTDSTCSFNSTDCKGAIKQITNNTKIPITNKEIILVGMKLCQTHYNKFIINEAHNLKHNETCSHPKHDEYKNETAKICSLCRKRTDKDPDYNILEEYNAPISKKENDNNILNIGNHAYSFRKDVLYSGEELKQFESDYQEIITQLTISNEISLSDKIKKMSNILYKNQRVLKQKTIYDPDEFKIMLEEADTDLIGFFDELYKGTNPNTKSDKTNNNNKKKLVSLCYFLAKTSGASASSIDTLANIGLSVSRRTVNRQKTYISEDHQYTVNDYCLQNIENMFILNIDDYHNIHRRNQPTLLKTHDINHFVTILLNSNSNIPKIPYYSLNRIPIHNPKGVDFKLIIDYIDVSFMSKLGKSYYQQNEMWKQYLSDDSYENKLEFLTVHNYDGRVQNQQELRSMKNSKLVDFILHPLHNTKDYIESSNILFKVFEKIEQEDYLNNFVIPTICDWPGQVNLRRAITLRLNKKENSGISPQILTESNTDKQIIQKAKTINIERNDDGFKNTFINTRNTNISKVKLISLEKKVSLFLLSFFDIIYHNIGKSSNNNNNNMFELPSFNNRNVNVKLFPLAWSTSNILDNDKICDAENCLLSNSSNIILICGHSYHKECLSLLDEKCKYCFNYLSESIKTNITSLNKRLFKPLKDNEISEFTEDKGLDEDYDDENIDSLLEQEEYNINNQYEIQYNIWLNYNNM